jgi:hypothetical protein
MAQGNSYKNINTITKYKNAKIYLDDSFIEKTKAVIALYGACNILRSQKAEDDKDAEKKLISDVKKWFKENDKTHGTKVSQYIEKYTKKSLKEAEYIINRWHNSFTKEQKFDITRNIIQNYSGELSNWKLDSLNEFAVNCKKLTLQNATQTINGDYASENILYHRISEILGQLTEMKENPLKLNFDISPFPSDEANDYSNSVTLGSTAYDQEANECRIFLSSADDYRTFHHEATHLFFKVKDQAEKNKFFKPDNDDDILVFFINAVLRFFGFAQLNDKNLRTVFNEINEIIEDPFLFTFSKSEGEVLKDLFPGKPKTQDHVSESLSRYRNPGMKLFVLRNMVEKYYEMNKISDDVRNSEVYQFTMDTNEVTNSADMTYSNCVEDLFKIASTLNYKMVQDLYKGSGYIDEEWLCRSMEVISTPKRNGIASVNVRLLKKLYSATDKLIKYTAKSIEIPYYSVASKLEAQQKPTGRFAAVCIALFFTFSCLNSFAFFGDETYKLGRPKMREEYSNNFYAGVSLGFAPFAKGGGLNAFEMSQSSRTSLVNYTGSSDSIDKLRDKSLDSNYYVAVAFGYKPRYSNFRQEIEFSNPSFFSKANLVSDSSPISFGGTGDGVQNLYFLQNHYRVIYHAFYHFDSDVSGLEYFIGLGGGVDMARISFSNLGATKASSVRISDVENGVFVKEEWGYGFVFEGLGGMIYDINSSVAMEIKGRVSVSTQDVNKTRASTTGDLVTLWFAGIELGFLLKL